MSKAWIESEMTAAAQTAKRGMLLPRLLTAQAMKQLEPKRRADSHKGTYGRIWLGGGAEGMAGAVLLALQAARRTGVGYNFVRVPAMLTAAILAIHPEALVAAISSDAAVLQREIEAVDAVCAGPGAGRADWFGDHAEMFMQYSRRLIIDADALNRLAQIPGWEELTSDRVSRQGLAAAILTPHPGEFKRLAPDLGELLSRDRQAAAAALAERSQTVVVLKGMATVIACPNGQTYLNPTGNDALAQAGSGDVLSGLIAGFSAQGLLPHQAAALAVYLHGLLADLAVAEYGRRGITPADLTDYLPQAYELIGWEL